MKTQFQQINILYLALLAGQILFAGVVFFLLNQGQKTSDGEFNILQTIVPVVLFGAVGAVYYIEEQRKAQIGNLKELEEKVMHYRGRVIVRSALIEGPNLLSVIGALLTGNIVFFAIFGGGLAVFYFYRPRLDRFFQEYKLSPAEQAKF